MFLHHTMTDQEILRTCEGCDSQHLRLVADRLRARVSRMSEIRDLAFSANGAHDLQMIWDNLSEIEKITKGE